MKKQFTLSVSSPCSEQWDTFSAGSNGSFCHSCHKDVIDFTQMSEQEIIGYFREQPEHVCGRFKSDQLKTYQHRTLPTLSPGWNLLRVGVFGLALMFASQYVNAVNPPLKSPTEMAIVQQDGSINPDQLDEITLTGIVTDENNQPFPGVNIYLKDDSTVGILSDENGTFQLSGNFQPGDIVVFSFLGYEPVEYIITQNIPASLEICLSDFNIMMGEVQVDKPYQQNESQLSQLWQKVKSIF